MRHLTARSAILGLALTTWLPAKEAAPPAPAPAASDSKDPVLEAKARADKLTNDLKSAQTEAALEITRLQSDIARIETAASMAAAITTLAKESYAYPNAVSAK